MTKKQTKIIWLCCAIIWCVIAAQKFIEKDMIMGAINLVVAALCLLNVFLTGRKTVNPENEILWIVEDEDIESEVDEEGVEVEAIVNEAEEEDANEEE